jgi:GntR family transcriptional regulator, transcriptional repressor for pyruvate dehydrogenase complex
MTTQPEANSGEGVAERADKISEVLARRIVREIARDHLAPGTRLPPEAAMLRRLGVGRASLREALRILEVYGLITIKPGPGGGPIVHAPTSREFARASTFYYHLGGATLRDLLEARRCVDPLLARLAAASDDTDASALLMESVDASERAYELDDIGTWRRHDFDFHGLVAAASGNRVMDLFGQSLRALFNDRVGERMMGAHDRDVVRNEHRAIANAIACRDPDGAERLMAAHMTTFSNIAAQVIEGLLEDVLDWR